MTPEAWAFLQQYGLPISMLVAFIISIHRKIFTPGWYAVYLEGEIKKLEAHNKALEDKRDELVQKGFELTLLARTALDVGKAVVEKES